MRLSILFSVMVWFLSIQPLFSSVLVSADWVKNNSGKIVILDVQNKKTAYGKGHIPNALQIIRHGLKIITPIPQISILPVSSSKI